MSIIDDIDRLARITCLLATAWCCLWFDDQGSETQLPARSPSESDIERELDRTGRTETRCRVGYPTHPKVAIFAGICMYSHFEFYPCMMGLVSIHLSFRPLVSGCSFLKTSCTCSLSFDLKEYNFPSMSHKEHHMFRCYLLMKISRTSSGHIPKLGTSPLPVPFPSTGLSYIQLRKSLRCHRNFIFLHRNFPLSPVVLIRSLIQSYSSIFSLL